MGKKREYSTEKITVTVDSDIARKLGEVALYPKWKGNKSAVVNEALREFFEVK